MNYIMKPFFKLIPAYFKDSFDFIKEIKNHEWLEGEYYGSLYVTYLYGYVTVVELNNIIDRASNFFLKNKVRNLAKDLTKMTLNLD